MYVVGRYPLGAKDPGGVGPPYQLITGPCQESGDRSDGGTIQIPHPLPVLSNEVVPWKFIDGIDFEFPYNVTIPARGYLIVTKKRNAFDDYLDDQNLNLPPGIEVFEWFDPANDISLSNGGERIELAIPGDKEWQKQRYYIPIEALRYDDEAPWPIENDGADGTGLSLNQITPDDSDDGMNYSNDAANWQATDPTPGQ